MIDRSQLNGKWPRVELGDVVEFLDHLRRPVTAKDREPGPFPYYGANGQQDSVASFIFDEPLVLLAEDGGHFGENDKSIAYHVEGKTWVNNHAHVLRPTSRIDIRFLCRYLENYDVRPFTSGTTRLKLNKAKAAKIPLALPPLPEQKRIAEILDRAEALRAKRRAALALLDELTQSIFLDMFGDPEVEGSRWPAKKIAEYVAEFQGGKSLESTDDNSSQRRVLKVSAVTGMKFRPHESKPIDDGYEPSEDHFVKNGDLLFSRANTTELVGAVAYVTNCPPNLLLPDKLWRFVWKDKKTVHPLFIWYLFQTRPVRREIGNRATGTSGSMKNISKAKLFGIPTILPPFHLQQKFADRITAVAEMQHRQKESLTKLDQLFASLQHRAFRGEL